MLLAKTNAHGFNASIEIENWRMYEHAISQVSEKVSNEIKLQGESPAASELKAGGSSGADWWDQWSTTMHFTGYRHFVTTQGSFCLISSFNWNKIYCFN